MKYNIIMLGDKSLFITNDKIIYYYKADKWLTASYLLLDTKYHKG